MSNHNFTDSRFVLFTASEIHRLMKGGKGGKLFGDGAMTYIHEKVAEVITGESKPSVGSAATQWGLDNEADAVKYFELVTGKKVVHYGCNNYVFFPYKNIGGCSPDGIVEADNATVQVKCPFLAANIVPYLLAASMYSKEELQEWLKVNEEQYYTQCQFEMMCASEHLGVKIEKCYFVVYAGADRMIEHYHRMVVIELSADLEMQNELDMRTTEANKILSEMVGKLQVPNPIYEVKYIVSPPEEK